MEAVRALSGWQPDTFLRRAQRLSQETFEDCFSSEVFLLINIARADRHFVSTLHRAPGLKRDLEAPTEPVSAVSVVHTATRPGEAEPMIPVSLVEEPHFVIPVRGGAAVAGGSRVTLGRAPETDIILRDRSVSKLHAWFEYDELGSVALRDAGSKNGTFVNSQQVETGDVELVSGDAVRFGNVEGTICRARTLWQILADY